MSTNFSIITNEMFRKEVDIKKHMGDLFDTELYIGSVIAVDGDFVVDGNLTLDDIDKMDSVADFIYINGNLIVNGDMNPNEETFPNILVLGNLFAHNVQNGEELVMINGNAKVENMIYGKYAHGALKINGSVTAKYIINYDHMMLLPNIEAKYVMAPFKDDSDHDPSYDSLHYNLFKKELLEKVKEEYIIQDEINMDKLVLDIKKSKKIFKCNV
ncbi:MAG: hypothetical protein AAF934_04305 [Bacteroidota bacterium]